MITSDSLAKTEPNSSARAANTRRAYKIREAADIIGCSEVSIRRLIARGLLRANRSLRHVLIPTSELDRFLQQ